MDKIKISLISLLIALTFTFTPAFATPPSGASGVVLTIDGSTGVTEQTMNGISVNRHASIVGTGITLGRTETNFSGVGVGSSAVGNLSYAEFNLGSGVAVPQVSGNGTWKSNASGDISLTKNTSTGNPVSSSHFRSVTGTYNTSSSVNIHINN